jgi:hypothetical protein
MWLAGHVPLLVGRCATCVDVQGCLAGHVSCIEPVLVLGTHCVPSHRKQFLCAWRLGLYLFWNGVRRLALGTLCSAVLCIAVLVCTYPSAEGVWT